MSIADNLLAILAPYECLGCTAEGSLLCDGCLNTLPAIAERCYRCRKLSPGALTCHSCRKLSKLRHVRVATVYDNLARELVWKLKFGGAQAASHPMITRMAQVISEQLQPSIIIIPVPTATRRVRQRGYDQAELLARELAHQTRLTYIPCLARVGQQHQVGANRRQRLRQLTGAFRVTHNRQINGASILLVDDVITTGATLEAAAHALRVAGARTIGAVVFAQP